MSVDEEIQERQRRAGVTQSQFRELNETVDPPKDVLALTDYACECAQKTCAVAVSLTLAEYEEVRQVPTYFLVAPGHVLPTAERVVHEVPDRYEVVEKIGLAGKVAAQLDRV
jgi:hypothetical protein